MFIWDLQWTEILSSVDLSTTALNATQREELKVLSKKFGDTCIYICSTGGYSGLGCTSTVQDEIQTSRPPLLQPGRQLPVVQKPIIGEEMKKMLQQSMIHVRPNNPSPLDMGQLGPPGSPCFSWYFACINFELPWALTRMYRQCRLTQWIVNAGCPSANKLLAALYITAPAWSSPIVLVRKKDGFMEILHWLLECQLIGTSQCLSPS